MEKKKLLVSFSGGETSAFMAQWLWLHKRNEYDIHFIFANTGLENNETLEFVDQVSKHWGFHVFWIEAKVFHNERKTSGYEIVSPEIASRNGEPFEAMIAKHGMPSVRSPHCTRELKKHAIYSYAKSIGWKQWHTAIGIRIDEIDRVSPNAKKERFIYPLVSNVPTRKNDINKFWSEQSFDLELKTYEGNCDLCFKKSFRKLMTLVKERPETIIWWSGIEFKYHDFIPDGKKHNKLLIPPINCFRQNKSIWDIVEMAKHPFELAIDESKYKPEYKQQSLFDLDISNGCTESCEVF